MDRVPLTLYSIADDLPRHDHSGAHCTKDAHIKGPGDNEYCNVNFSCPIGSGLCANEASIDEFVRRYGPRIGFALMLRRLRDFDDTSSCVDEHAEYMLPILTEGSKKPDHKRAALSPLFFHELSAPGTRAIFNDSLDHVCLSCRADQRGKLFWACVQERTSCLSLFSIC